MKNEFLIVNADELFSKLNEHNQTLATEQSKAKANEADSSFNLVNTKQLCELFNVSRVTIYHWRKKGIIPYKKISKMVYFDLKEVQDSLISINLADRKSVAAFIEEKGKR
jgi:predicted DNA-binding transcriptional regulator AlpA